MTLQTTSDGLLTLEGLVVANQEEVKKWLLHQENFSTETFGVHDSFTMYLGGRTLSLPDDQFEAKYQYHINNRGQWYECTDLEYAFSTLETKEVVTILRKPVSDVGEKNYTEHRSFIPAAKKKKPLSEKLEVISQKVRNIEGEKKEGLGGSSSLENMIRELLIDLEGHASSYGAHQDKPFHKGKAEAYRYSAKKIRDIFQWLGIETRKPLTP